MQKILGLGTAFIALLALTAAAIAAQAGPSPSGQVQTAEVSHSPSKKSSKKKKVGTRVNVLLTLSKTDGTKPSPTGGQAGDDVTVTLPAGMGLNYAKFPKCNQSRLQSSGPRACPRGSRVGTGSLEADASPVLAKVGGTVTAFNGTGRTYLLYVVPEISSPLIIRGRLQGSRRLTFEVPLVPTLPGQPNATLTRFQVTTGATFTRRVRGKRKKYNYLENPRTCPRAGYAWRFDFKYENGETLSVPVAARC